MPAVFLPDITQFYIALGWRLNRIQRHTGSSSIEDYTEAIKRDPDNARYYFVRGHTWSNLGEYEKAIEDYSTAIDRDPYEVVFYYSRGIAWERLGEYEQAVNDFEVCIALSPESDTSSLKMKIIAIREKQKAKRAVQRIRGHLRGR